MKNKILKKTTCFFLFLSLLLSSFTLISFADESSKGVPYVGENILSELKFFIPGVTEDIPLKEDASIGLGNSLKLDYLQKASINIDSEEAFEPSEKDVLFILDTSFTDGDTSQLSELLEHTLFSRENANIQGESLKIEGDSFIKDEIILTNTGVDIDGNIEYSSVGPQKFKSVIGDEINLSDCDEDYKNRYDDIFPPDSEDAGFNEMNYIFEKILKNARNNINKNSFSSFFPKDTRDIYNIYASNEKNNPYSGEFPSPNHGSLINVGDGSKFSNPKNGQILEILLDPSVSSDLRVKYNPVVIHDNLDEPHLPAFKMGDFEITSGEPFVIRSDMYFEGNINITVPSISKEISTDGEAGFIFADGDIILQGGKTTIADDLFLVSMNGNIKIESGENDFTGLALAPNGTIEISGRQNNYTGSFIGKNLNITPGNSTFTGPENPHELIPEDYRPPSTNLNNKTQNAIFNFISNLGSYTKPNAILYSAVAMKIESNKDEDFTDTLKEGLSERNDINFDDEESVDPNIFLSNLGDALRLASYEFSELEDSSTEKYVVVFTGTEPDTYSSHYLAEGMYMEEGPAPSFKKNSEKGNEGKEYVEAVISDLLPDVNLVFVDISSDNSMDDYFKELFNNYKGSRGTGSIALKQLENIESIPEILATLLEDKDIPVYKNYSLDLKKVILNAPLPPSIEITSAFINDTKIDNSKIKLKDNVLSIEIPVSVFGPMSDPSIFEINDLKITLIANPIGDKLEFIEESYGKYQATISFNNAYIDYTFDVLLNEVLESEDSIEIPFDPAKIKIKHAIDTN